MIEQIYHHLSEHFGWYWIGVSCFLAVCSLLACVFYKHSEDAVIPALVMSSLWPVCLTVVVIVFPFFLVYCFGAWLREIRDLRNQPPLNEHPTAIRVCKPCLEKFPNGTYGRWTASCPHV